METDQKIKALRNSTGLSQSQFAKQFHIPTATLQDWEHGRRRPPDYVVHMMEQLLQVKEGGKE